MFKVESAVAGFRVLRLMHIPQKTTADISNDKEPSKQTYILRFEVCKGNKCLQPTDCFRSADKSQ
jgi:hypothetical protein